MELDDLKKAATTAEMAAALDEQKESLHLLRHPHPPGPSIREEVYKGHHIKVVTTYEITVDGRPVSGHLSIDNSGSVHYHAIPNQEFLSMIDMVKRIIDVSAGLGTLNGPSGPDDHDHGGHNHGHGHD
ncbi:MAG TPA: hypothetical protein VHJ78_08645 [Actinomycetota bacterium]|nr:hypothetical protein [Actinomycetota bacterium]